MEAVIRHLETSKAEGYPGIIRVITPMYISLTEEDKSRVTTNYTDGRLVIKDYTIEYLHGATHVHTFDIIFQDGITFPDIIELSFTLTVDPTGLRLPGSGAEASTIIMSPICHRNIIDDFPLVQPDLHEDYEVRTQCGDFVGVQFTALANGMFWHASGTCSV